MKREFGLYNLDSTCDTLIDIYVGDFQTKLERVVQYYIAAYVNSYVISFINPTTKEFHLHGDTGNNYWNLYKKKSNFKNSSKIILFWNSKEIF